MTIPVIVVAGPTASGKSDLALAIAERFSGIVINADSMQLYRELAVITARPKTEAETRAPHRLYGVLPAAERCSVGKWREMALTEIDAADKAGRVPVVTGGTGLYLRALLTGLSRIPPVPEAIRGAARHRLDRIGSAAFHAELAEVDPVTAARLSPGDSQRMIRAREVLEATGRPLSDWQREPFEDAAGWLRFATILMMPPREALFAACDARFVRMVEEGAVEEARAFARLGLDPDLPACKALGLRPLIRCATGELTLEETISVGQRQTRRYAKRQMTWFRHQMISDRTVFAQYSESVSPQIFSYISDFLLTRTG